MLPLELIHHIIDELGSQIRDRDSRTAIQQCARTSRSFRNRARRYMFANVAVIEQKNRKDTQKKVDNIRGILESDPSVAKYFQEFTISLDKEAYLTSCASGFVHVLNIIRATLGRNGLNKLTISVTGCLLLWPGGDFDRAFCAICEACIPKQVEIYDFSDVPLITLGHCLGLQSFSSASIFAARVVADSEMDDIFKAYPPTNSSLIPCKWRTLELSGFFYALCTALANIVGQKGSPVFGNLEFLQVLMTSMLDRFALDLILMSAKNALRTLECVIVRPWDGPVDLINAIDIGSTSLPNLQTLRLQFHGIPQHPQADSDFWVSIADSILILRPQTKPSDSLSELEIILNLQCDSQENLDGVTLYDDTWTLLDTLIVDDLWRSLRNVHFEIKVGTYLKPANHSETFNFDAFSNFFEKRFPRASRSKTLNLTMTTGSTWVPRI